MKLLSKVNLGLAAAATMGVAASDAQATDYVFHVSAAVEPAFRTRTYAEDQVAEFETVSRLMALYLRYSTVAAITRGIAEDYVYVVYHDGQIGKFKVVNPLGTIKVESRGKVPAVPAGAQQRTSIDSVQDWIARSDYSNSYTSYFAQTLGRGSVEVIQYWVYEIY